MASKKAYVDHLRSVPLFAGCTRKELERIARSGDEVKMTAGTLLVDQGQTGVEAFVMLEGSVTVKRNGRKMATLGPGAIVGELSLLDHGPRTATAVVRDGLHAVRDLPTPLPRRARRRADDRPQVARRPRRPHPRARPRSTTAELAASRAAVGGRGAWLEPTGSHAARA